MSFARKRKQRWQIRQIAIRVQIWPHELSRFEEATQPSRPLSIVRVTLAMLYVRQVFLDMCQFFLRCSVAGLDADAGNTSMQLIVASPSNFPEGQEGHGHTSQDVMEHSLPRRGGYRRSSNAASPTSVDNVAGSAW